MSGANEPPSNEPDGWREPRGGDYALWVVIIGVAIFLGVGLVACVAAIATYG